MKNTIRGAVAVAAALAAFVPFSALAGGRRVHAADQVLQDNVRQTAGGLEFVDADGIPWSLVTSTDDPVISNRGSGSFHPASAAEVERALNQVSLAAVAALDCDIFLLPYPRRDLLPSSAGRHAIYVSPGVYDYAAGPLHMVVVHEMGHVVQQQALPDADTAGWQRYRELRGLTDPARYNATAAHRDRPHEIFAEDFRFLFGGAQANYSGTIENPDLCLPDDVPGLREFFEEIVAGRDSRLAAVPPSLAAWPSPFRLRATLCFTLPRAESGARVDILDVSGRLVRSFETAADGGEHLLSWDGLDATGSPAPSGTYFARLAAGQQRAACRLILAR